MFRRKCSCPPAITYVALPGKQWRYEIHQDYPQGKYAWRTKIFDPSGRHVSGFAYPTREEAVAKAEESIAYQKACVELACQPPEVFYR